MKLWWLQKIFLLMMTYFLGLAFLKRVSAQPYKAGHVMSRSRLLDRSDVIWLVTLWNDGQYAPLQPMKTSASIVIVFTAWTLGFGRWGFSWILPIVKSRKYCQNTLRSPFKRISKSLLPSIRNFFGGGWANIFPATSKILRITRLRTPWFLQNGESHGNRR